MNADHYTGLAFALGMAALCVSVVFSRLDSAHYQRNLRRDQQARQQWTRRLADATFDGILIHRNGTVLAMNRALMRLLGCREVEILGQSFAGFARGDQSLTLRAELEAPASHVVEFTLLDLNGAEHLVELTSNTIEHEGMPATLTAIRDVTASRADKVKIELLLNHDTLTGLANRNLFAARLAAAIARNDREGGTTALLTLDLERFKTVNERLGRAAGDLLLRQIATKFISLAHESDTIARLSGDKFGIIQPHQGAPNRALALAARLDSAFAQGFLVEGHAVKLGLAAGIAIYPDHATDAESLERASLFALDLAEKQGGGHHMFSHAEEQAAELAALALIPDHGTPRPGLTSAQKMAQDLRAALRRGEISLEYQPVFRARDLSLAGFEALARWRHPLEGWIPPSVFIPLAEQTGMIHEIGGFVLETACRQAAASASLAGGSGGLVMAVNLSPLQFRDPQLAPRLAAILEQTGLKPESLELEVTESLLIDNAEAALTEMKAIRAIGVGVALDDFGTGFSSLSYLCDFPFTRLKIDKRFIQGLGRDTSAESTIAAILSMARNLSLAVTAEGVETPSQLAWLQEQGCQLVQGFLLGLPGTGTGPMAALVKQSNPAKPALVIANG